MAGERITRFHAGHRFLSNFYLVPIEYDGIQYPSVEHAYQAAKTLDLTRRKKICAASRPGLAKAMGSTVPLREGWDEMKLDVMEELLRHKFSKHRYPILHGLLKYTGTAMLIEGNNWGDRFWGMTLEAKLTQFGDGEAHKPEWVGENWLGRLLMKIRDGKGTA